MNFFLIELVIEKEKQEVLFFIMKVLDLFKFFLSKFFLNFN